jgi:RNA polymerase sigma-70 factor, ECF subfamily
LRSSVTVGRSAQALDSYDGWGEAMSIDIQSLYRSHRQRAHAIAWAYLKDDDEALDAVHEAFVRVQRASDGFNARSSPQTWLFRIVINVCLDMRRHRRRHPELHVDDIDMLAEAPQGSPEKSAELLELRAAICAGLARLSEAHRDVLVMREMSGLDYEQIANAEGCPRGTVMSRLFHARRRLRHLLRAHAKRSVARAA